MRLQKVCLLACILCITSGWSADRYWVAASAGTWNISANWSTAAGGAGGAGVPGPGDTAHFDGGGPGACTISANASVLRVEIEVDYSGVVSIAGSKTFTVGSLKCDGSFIVGKSSKLAFSSGGLPVSGTGTIDTTTNVPNTVEYKSNGDVELSSSSPLAGYSNLTLTPPGGMSRDSIFVDETANKAFDSIAADFQNGFLYVGTYYNNPATVVKIRISDFARVAALKLNAGEMNLSPSFVYQGFLYLGTRTSPGKIVKIRLSDFSRVGAITLDTGEDQLWTAALDDANGVAYFGTRTIPGKIVKVDLSTFTRVSALTLDPSENEVFSSVFDPAGGKLYIGTRGSPGRIVKIRTSDFSREANLDLALNENEVSCALLDSTRGNVYFSTHTIPASIIRVRLSDFTRTGTLVLAAGEGPMKSALLDSAKGMAYFGADTFPGAIVKVNVSTFKRVETLALNEDEGGLLYSVIDPANGFAYYPLDQWDGNVLKVNLNYKTTQWHHENTLAVLGNLSIGKGILNSGGHDVTLTGNWSNSGTYKPGANSVQLVGGNQNVTGDNTFNNLSKVSAVVATLKFESNRSLLVNGKLTLQGAPGKLLRVNSTTTAVPFRLVTPAYQVSKYILAKDIDASGGRPLVALSSTDGGRNVNVLFPAGAQVSFSTPAVSITNPAWVEGTCGPDVTTLTMKVDSQAESSASMLSQTLWFADNASQGGGPYGVLLSDSTATHIVLTASNGELNRSASQDVSWAVTDVAGQTISDTLRIRKGDSLLLTATGAGTVLTLDFDGNGSTDFTGIPGQPFPAKYVAAGAFTAVARIDGIAAGALTVQVLDAQLNGPIACEKGFQREKDVTIVGGTAPDVSFEPNDPFILTVSLKQPLANGARLNLTPEYREGCLVLARLPGPSGALLAKQAISAFIIDSPAIAGIFVNGDGLGQSELFMAPYVEGIDFRFNMFASTSTFLAGAKSFTINTSASASTIGEPGFSPGINDSTDEAGSLFKFTVQMPDGEFKYCFTMAAFQNNVRISFDK